VGLAAVGQRGPVGSTGVVPRSAVGVVLVAPSHGRQQVHAMTDLGTVIVTGPPGELLLYSFGRRGVAQVDLSGAEEALIAI
jgi:hypothetical protein